MASRGVFFKRPRVYALVCFLFFALLPLVGVSPVPLLLDWSSSTLFEVSVVDVVRVGDLTEASFPVEFRRGDAASVDESEDVFSSARAMAASLGVFKEWLREEREESAFWDSRFRERKVLRGESYSNRVTTGESPIMVVGSLPSDPKCGIAESSCDLPGEVREAMNEPALPKRECRFPVWFVVASL